VRAGIPSAVDTQHGFPHTFAHFTVLCAFWTFPYASVFVTERVASSVRVVSDACHALWESVVILNISPSNQNISQPLS